MDERKGLVLTRKELLEVCFELRTKGLRVVFTNGCFDLLHIGHVRYLRAAAELGDRLIVAVNSDHSVKLLKGEGRPVTSENERSEILAALRMVDYVTIFDEETPYELIKAIQPDVLVKGGDYSTNAAQGERYIVGSDLVRAHGGSVAVVQYVEGKSTSSLIESLNNSRTANE